jgi:hypothetical protein
VAYTQDVKAIRAGLIAGLTSPMRLNNVELTNNDESVTPSDVWP